MSSKTPSQTILKHPPNLSFPPKYTSTQPQPQPRKPHSPTQRTPPAFNFPFYHKPSSPQHTSQKPPNIHTEAESQQSTFLTIPLEIRLQIYHYVLLDHPIQHPHLAPNPSQEKPSSFCKTMLKPAGLSLPNTYPCITNPNPNSNSQSLSSSPTTIAKIPTSLLLTCTQIYTEAATLPFQLNTFTFVNWFGSGIYAARQFTRSLRPWQSREVKWVGLEVLGRDLRVGERCAVVRREENVEGKGEAKIGEWENLCSLWNGVRGLRLGVKGSLREKKLESPYARKDKIESLDEEKESCLLGVSQNWVVNGLLKLGCLRLLELEIEDGDISRETKMRFCMELEELFNSFSRKENRSDGSEGDVRVIFMERAEKTEQEDKNGGREIGFYIGEPGDEEVWGVDLASVVGAVGDFAVFVFWSVVFARDAFL